MITIGMAYLLAALAASGIVIAAGWRSRYARGLAVMRDSHEIPNDPLWGDPEIETPEIDAPGIDASEVDALEVDASEVDASEVDAPEIAAPEIAAPEIEAGASESPADVAAAMRLALKRMAPVMATRSMKVDVAVQSGLLGRMRGTVLADLVAELLTAAIHGAPGSRLLLTAAAHGDRVHVRVTDDLAGADPAVRAAGVRDLMQRVALRGGSLNIDVRPAEGTTLTLRFAGGW